MRDVIEQAVAVLRRGGLVVHATEGVWGLACDPFCETAVERLLHIKDRPVRKGLILIGASEAMFAVELENLASEDQTEILASWPGPNTWVVNNTRFPAWITGEAQTVAIRVPGHAQARLLCAGFGGPIVSTSANVSGEAPAVTEQQASRLLERGVDWLLEGQVNDAGLVSQIRTVDGQTLRAR
ncbi:MAG: L-threonylcarbamoyladenylate synthase [Proteobacteria bacterium]|nr:L-threonylcarbamoyladenylate synthase [Pseudomonadota bacterium]